MCFEKKRKQNVRVYYPLTQRNQALTFTIISVEGEECMNVIGSFVSVFLFKTLNFQKPPCNL